MSELRSIADGLASILLWRWRYWLCEAIDRVRPGQGHDWLLSCDPPACRWCGDCRGGNYTRRRSR